MSFDTVAENAAFKANNELPYALWSDLDRELALYYGAASTAGQWFANRITVILDPDGNWVLEYAPSGNLYLHAQLVLDDLAILMAQ